MTTGNKGTATGFLKPVDINVALGGNVFKNRLFTAIKTVTS